MYPRSEILFPRRCVRGLSRLLDQKWDELVNVALRAATREAKKDSPSLS